MWFLRSTARSAFESAIVWFWQTRHRSSDATLLTRASNAASPAAGGVAFTGEAAKTASKSNAHSLLTIELIGEREYLLLDDLRCERAHVLVAYDTALIDGVRLRCTVHPVIDRDSPF